MYSTTDIIKIFQEKGISLFTLADFGRLFSLENQQTLYKKIQRLERAGIIQKLIKGKYYYQFKPAPAFRIANFLYPPSYVSLESALSFHGVITGFPYQITSLTTQKSKLITADNREFNYSQISAKLFWGYEAKDNFLIAEKEKALLDYIYFGTKGLRNLEFDEMDFSGMNKKKLYAYARRMGLTKKVQEKIVYWLNSAKSRI